MWRLVVGIAAMLVLAAPAHAEAPCKGCLLELPKGEDAVPLVVVLHGDREHAKNAAARWRAAVKAKGWAMLALECPKDEGCKDSFWKWDGDTKWVLDQIAAAGKQRTLGRVYLVGWSGGATYLSRHPKAWEGVATALVFHGGGTAPFDQTCVSLPAYFLVGDKNPLHYLTQGLREYFDTCKATIVWDLVKGGDHAREAKALTAKKARAILDWLEAR
jgi:poly(3-hydroxybutyrate) depolymerase